MILASTWPAEPAEGKPGEFDVFVEGIDNDDDEAWNEDPGDGVAFNRNFSFQYQPFQLQTGPHAVSEVETRAVADFVWDHPHIAVVFCLGRHDNLTEAWKMNSQDRGRVRTSVDSRGRRLFRLRRQAISGEWSNWRRGRRSLSMAVGWRGATFTSDDGPSAVVAGGFRKSKRTREMTSHRPHRHAEGSSQPGAVVVREFDRRIRRPRTKKNLRTRPRNVRSRAAGAWRTSRSSRHGTLGRRIAPRRAATCTPVHPGTRQTIEWHSNGWIRRRSMAFHALDHPGPPRFPWTPRRCRWLRPWWRENPPVRVIDELAANHLEFVKKLATLLPRLEIESLTRESLGHGIFRVSATIANPGYLPTCTDLGDSGRLTYPVQVELILPDGAKTLTEPVRRRSSAIKGGGTVKHVWLVQVADSNTVQVTVRASSIMVGSATAELDLSPAPREKLHECHRDLPPCSGRRDRRRSSWPATNGSRSPIVGLPFWGTAGTLRTCGR